MLPVIPTAIGSNRRRQAAARAWRAGSGWVDPDHADRLETRREGARPADHDGGGPGLDGGEEMVVTVRALPGEGHEEVARDDPAGVDGGAVDGLPGWSLEPPTRQTGDLGGVQGLVGHPAGRRRRRGVGHGRQSPTAGAHRLPALGAMTGLGRSRVRIESAAIRRKSS